VSLHPGMKFVFTKGKMKGRKGTIINVPSAVAGNEVLIKTSKRTYWVNKDKLSERVKWSWEKLSKEEFIKRM